MCDPLPFVSVIVPTYNRRRLLELTLQSLRSQDYKNYEVLVCDDCSTDDTFEFLTALQGDWTALRIFRNDRNLNFNGTLQRLFSLANGEFIGMQHDHDIYKPQFLSKMVELLLSNPNAGFGCAAYDLIDQQDRLILNPELPERKIFRNGSLPGHEFLKVLAQGRYTPIAAMSTVFRRSAIDFAGGYKTDWYLASDEDFYRRIAQVSDVAFCPEPLLSMRLRPVERQRILGGWRSIYTLFLFRISTAILLGKSDPGLRNRALVRQFANKWRALFWEGILLWLTGEGSQLKEALNPDVFPHLPTNRKPMHRAEIFLLKVFIWPLVFSVRMGKGIYAIRKALRPS